MPKGLILLCFTLFLPLSILYALVAQFSCYFRFRKTRRRSKSFTKKALLFSIGNIAAGGRGKTPITIALAKFLEGKGLRVAIILRGIGRDVSSVPQENPSWQRKLDLEGACFVPCTKTASLPSDSKLNHVSPFFGDEATLCAYHLGEKKVVIAPKDRLQGLRFIEKNLCVDAVVFDDALQCKEVPMDLHIALMGQGDLYPQNPVFAFARYLPLGTQRIATLFLKRAGFLLLQNQFAQQSTDRLEKLVERLYKTQSTAALMHNERFASFCYVPSCFEKVSEEEKVSIQEYKLRHHRNTSAIACAIANPSSFIATLNLMGICTNHCFIEQDHGLNSQKKWEKLCRCLLQKGVTQVLITEKDAVKLRSHKQLLREYSSINFYALIIEAQIQDPFFAFIESFLKNSPKDLTVDEGVGYSRHE